MRKAIYAGSFDPPTNGHVWMIREAVRLFDEVVIAIGINPAKKCFFPVATRTKMLQDITRDLPTVTVTTFETDYLIDYAERLGATHLFRGIRNGADTELESVLRQVNADMVRRKYPDSHIETVFMMPPRGLVEVSSSMVKGLMGPEGWERTVAEYVPPEVLIRLIGARHHWLWEALVVAGAKGDEDDFWKKALAPYLEPHRVHHGVAHPSEVLSELCRVRHLLKDPALTGFSAVGHDRIYDVQRRDNEKRSAEFAREFAKELGLPDSFGEKAALQVLATIEHESDDPDTQFLVDADMAVLGYPPRRFDEYERGTGDEYRSHYTPQEFIAGRTGWILKFLMFHSKRIYATDFFEDRYGAQARANLTRSYECLKENL